MNFIMIFRGTDLDMTKDAKCRLSLEPLIYVILETITAQN